MSYPATVDNGMIAPTSISNDAITSPGLLTLTLSANTVYLFAFELQAPITITALRWRVGATVLGTGGSAGKTNMCIYTFAGGASSGSIIAGSDTGAIANVASTVTSPAYASAFQLGPGQYWLGLACDNATDTFLGITAPSGAGQMSHQRTATNTLSAGAMPLTTGAITNTTKAPGMDIVFNQGTP